MITIECFLLLDKVSTVFKVSLLPNIKFCNPLVIVSLLKGLLISFLNSKRDHNSYFLPLCLVLYFTLSCFREWSVFLLFYSHPNLPYGFIILSTFLEKKDQNWSFTCNLVLLHPGSASSSWWESGQVTRVPFIHKTNQVDDATGPLQPYNFMILLSLV